MRKLTQLFASALTLALVTFSTIAPAEETDPTLTDGYISDELFVYMHSGAGNNYRIVGSINAGTLIKLTGVQQNGYTQIIDDKNRSAWVEDKYVSNKPGLRFVVAELNGQLASNTEIESQLQTQLATSANKLTTEVDKNAQLAKQLNEVQAKLTEVESQFKNQDMDMKKEWFFNGAIVMGIGLILGLLLPRLASRKKSSMESWN